MSMLSLAALLVATSARADEADLCADAAEAGQKLRDEQKPLQAREKFLRCAKSSCPALVRDDCVGFAADIEKRIPSVVLRAKNEKGDDLSDVRVSSAGKVLATKLDGAPVQLEPGAYELSFEVEGLPAATQKVVVAEGEQRRVVEVVLRASPKPGDTGETKESGVGPAPWIIGGIGLAGLTVFGVLQGVAWAEHADVEERCGAAGTCTDEDLDPLRGKFIGSLVGLGIGAAGVVTSAILFGVLSADSDTEVQVQAGPDGGSLGILVHF
ncbi:MAG: hypothetical protein HOV80_30570 [Polyangiaceae bacterium]|nr:hypothetical protein [Polyangiaceae bacterium]